MSLQDLFTAIRLFNEAAPGFQQLYLAIKGPDGTLTAVETLDKADAIFADNEKAIDDWLAAHPPQP